MKKISWVITPLALFVVFAVPIFASAQYDACPLGQTLSADGLRCLPAGGSGSGVNVGLVMGYSESIIRIINNVFVPVLFAVAFLYFVWGIYKYFILGATEEAAKGEGRQFVLWSLIGFAVILSLWGLVNVVTSVFNLTGTLAPNPPRL